MRNNPLITGDWSSVSAEDRYANNYRKNYGMNQVKRANNEPVETGFFDAIKRGSISGGASVPGGQADFLNIFTGIGGDFGDYMQEVAQDNQRKKEYELGDYVPFASDYYTNPEGLTYDASNAAGSMAALAAEAAALYYGAGLIVPSAARGAMAVGARSIAKKIATKAAEHGMPWVGKVMNSPSGKLLALQLASTPLEAASEAGNTAREVKGKGGSAEEQKSAAAQDFAVNSAILTFTNALQVGGLGKLIDDFGGKDKFMTVMKGIAGGAVENAYEEGAQQSASEYAQDKNGSLVDVFNPYGWSEEAKNAAAVGGITGGLLGGVGVAGGNKLNNVYQNRENLQQATNEEPYDEGVMDDLLEKKNDKATKQNIPEQNLQGYDSIPDNQLLLLGEGQGDGGVNQYGKGSFNGGLFRKPSEISHQMQGRVNEQLFTQQNDTKPLGFQQTIDALNDSFALPKITNENIKAKGFAKKNHYLNANQKKIQQNIPQQQQYSLNEENTSLVRTATGPKSMGRAGNMFLASQPIANKFDMKNAFEPKQQESVTDVNRAADRLMAEQYINQAFDQRQPFMPQGYGSTTRQEQGQLLANLLNARAASEWDKAAGLTREQRRSNMPFVPQRASLYNGALRRNLERLDRIKPDELPSVSNETTDVNRRAAEIQRLREQVIPQSRENAKKFAAPALLEERGKAKARSISLQARSRVREDAILADERKAKKHAKERYEAVKNDVIGFIVPYKTIKEQLKGVNFLRKSVVEQLHEQLEPIYSELVKGMGHGVTDEWVEKGTYIPTDVGDLIGHPEAGKNSHTADHLRYSNNAPWYQQWFKRYGRKPRKAEIYQVAEDILTNRGDSWAWPDKMYDGSPEANQYLAEVREDIDMKHDYINACDVVKQELKNGKLFTEADYKQVDLPQEVQNAQTEKTAESKGNDENSVLERNPQEQADYQGENKNGEAEELDKAKSRFEKLKENFRNSLMKLEEAQKEIDKIFDGLLANSPFVKSLKEQADKEIVKMDKEKRNLAREEKVKLLQKATAEALYKDDDLVTAAKTATRKSEFYQEYNQAFFEKINKLSDIGVIISNPIAQRPYMLEFYENVTGTKWDKSQNHKLNEQAEVSAEKAESKPAKKSAASVINDYKHTTKKTMIKAAKLDKDFSDDEFKEAKKLAEENGGFYSKYASQKSRTKGIFLFEKGGAEGRDAFVAALNEKFGDKQEASVEPALERGITRDVDAEQNNKARERIAAENKNESQENKGYRTSNRDWGTTVNVKNNEVTISFNKSFGNMPPIKFTVAEYQKAAVSSVNRLSGIRKFLMPKVDAHNQEWIDAAPNENVRLAREDDVAMHGKDLADVLQKLVDTVMEKAGIEAADRNTLFNRAKTKNVESKEDVQKAEVERVAKEVSKEPSLGMYARKGDQADFVRHYMNVAEDTISGLGEEEPLSLDSVSTKELEKMFAPHMVKLYNEIRAKDNAASADTLKNNPDAVLNDNVANSSEGQAIVKSVIDKSEKESLKLADGYSVENGKSISEANKDEFILYNGEKNLGRISEDVAENSNGFLQAAPIRLQVGNAEFGLVHLLKHEKQMRDKGFKNVFDFIRHVANNFNRVYSQQTEKKPNRFALYCSEDTSKGLMAVDLEIKKDTDGYYTIVSAMPHKPKIKGTLVYDGSSRPSTVTTDSLLSSDTNNKGGDDAEIVLAKPNVPFSKSSLAQTDEVVKKSESTTPSDEKVVESSQKENSEGGKDNADNNGSLRAVPQRSQADNVQETGSGEQVGGVPEQEVRGSEGVQGRDVRTAERTRPSDRGGLSGESETQQQTVSTSGRTDKRNVAEQGLTPAQQSNAKAEEVPGHNFIIKSSSDVADNGAKTKFKGNIAAITLLKKLEAEGRMATPAEQKVLAKYIGWGPLQEAFNGKRYPDWESEAEELKNLLTPKEWNAARDSVLTAFYTPPKVIKSIYGIVQRLGFKGGRVLDPAMGSGNFFGAMPERLRKKCMLRGVEIETISGGMAKQLYQDASVEVIGYENAYLDNEGYDLVITNVPFKTDIHPVDADFKAWNFNLHNYFFAKSVQKVRPGGLICFITSENTMKSNGKDIRKYLADKVDFIGAIKLPDNTFKSYAGTTVTSDLIILQKRGEDGKPSKYAKEWLRSDTRYLKDAEGKTLYGDINEYYVNNPEMVIGQWARGNYGSVIASGKGLNVSEEIDKLVEAFPKNIYKEVKVKRKNDDTNASTVKYLSSPDLQNGSIVVSDSGEIMVKSGSSIVPFGDKAKKGYQKDAKCAGNYVRVRDVAKQLLEKQLNPEVTDEELQGIRNDLNKAYDNFVAEHGPLGANGKLLSSDPDYGLICSIENYSYNKKTKETTSSKTAIFTQRTVNAIKPATSAANENDALLLSLSTKGRLDLEYMQKLLGGKKSQEDILAALGDKVFKDPVSDDYVMADEYLSGNVREKLEHARMAAQTDKSYTKNVKALEKVIPQNLTEKDIHASLGSAWIPAQDIEAFANELMETNRIKVDFVPSTGTWTVDAGYADNNIKGTQIYGTKERSFGEILSAALNQKAITITHDKEVDVKATDLANAMVKKVQDAFEKWIWTDEKRRDRLVNFYNNNFNATVLREYDGSMLTMPGYSAIAPQLRKHQKDAIWRIVQNGTCLLAHCVGAGKTWVMQASAMEQKRLGLINKPMFTIPNHMVEQFTNEFRQIYPNAKLLVLTTDNLPEVGGGNSKNAEVVKANKAQRKATLARIATEDWDGIIISHEIFKRIPMSRKAYEEFYQQQIDELEMALTEAQNAEDERSLTVKELVSKLKKSREKMENLMKVETKDLDTPFDKLGIDQIYVDEADLFKNLSYVTNMTRVSGLSNSNSQRSQDMYIKTQYLLNTHNGRGVVFATGTPISNTIAEMFTMLRYLNPKALKEHGVSFFDTFINTFSKKETTIESKPEGNGYRQVEKFVRFYNMGGLKRMFREVADVKTQADLDIKIPELKNGKRTVTEVPGSKELNQYITREVKKRAEDIHNGNVQPDVDNMLKLTSDMRKATLDMRLLDKYKNLPLEVAAPKLKAVSENVYKKYQESSENKGTQLIFCDLATPKGTSDKELSESANEEVESKEEQQAGVNAYSSIGKELIKMGIPANEIAFIHDAKNDEQKEALFAKVRNGEVRVLIGSTSKMGAGTNIQKRVVAEHHVDCPWRPRDIEQREGRALRQGNMNDEVEIFTYITKGSLDEFMWEKIKNKASMIEQAMNADLSINTVEDISAEVLSYAEIQGLASGDPFIPKRVTVAAELNSLNNQYREYRDNIVRNKRTIGYNKEFIAENEKAIAIVKEDIKGIKSVVGNDFTIKIDGKTFDKFSEAEEYILDIAENDDRANMHKGSFGGLDFTIRYQHKGFPYRANYFNNVDYTREARNGGWVAEFDSKAGDKCYISAGSLRAMSNLVGKSLDNFVESKTAKNKQYENEIAEAEKALKLPFDQEDKLKELQEEQTRIDKHFTAIELAAKFGDKYRSGAAFQTTNGEEYHSLGNTKIEDTDETSTALLEAVNDKTGATEFISVEDIRSDNNKYSIDAEVAQRTRESVLEEVKKAFPTAKISYNSDGNLVAEMPNGRKVGVVIEDKIILNQQQAKSAGKAHNIIANEAEGYWNAWEKLNGSDVLGVIHVSRNSRVGTAFHEVLHAAMDLSLTSKEKEALYKHFKKVAEKSGRDIEEEIADGYKEWVLKRQQGQGSLFGKLYKKAVDFLNKLYTMFVNANNVGNIFRKIESGKVYDEKYSGVLYEQKAMKSIRASIAQAISSAETSIKQIPAIFKKIPWEGGTVNIDIGGGKFDLATDFVKEKGVENIVFDPFNRDYDHNSKAFEKIKQGGDTVTVANVLNVIAEENARDNVILQAARALKPNGTAYFGIYEGSKDGVGKVTSKGWQNNKKAGDYISEVEKHFNNVRKAGNIIIATEPNLTADEKAVWSMDDTWQNTVKYSIAPAKNKLASTFTNTERKNIIETFKDWFAEQRKDFYVKWFDKNDRLHDFDKAIEMGVGKKVDESKKVYSRVQTLPATSAGMATALIEGNAEHIKVINDRLKHKKLKHNATMQMVLNVINKSKMDKLHPSWLKENGFDSWINALGAYLGSARLLEMSKRAKEEGVEYKFPNGLTSEELMNYIAKAPAEFKRAADLYYKFNDNMLTIMEDAGLISEETHKVLNEKYKHYCPLMRDFSDTAAADAFIGGLSNGGRGIANVSSPLKRIRIEGSERNVFNPLESTLKAVSVICNRAERNKVGQMAVELAQEAGLENVVVEVEGDKADEKNCIFTVMQNGKKQAYQTTQELYGPIVGYNLPAAGLMLGVARSAAHLLRTGATMSPSFIVRNLIRDTIFAGVASKNGFTPILDTIRGAQALLKDEKMRAEFETAGITKFNFYNTADEIARSLDEMAGGKEWRDYSPSELWSALMKYPIMTSEFVESATRMGEFLKAREKGMSVDDAARAARELTLDFSRSGVTGEKVNQIVPFFNACLQGGDKLYRMLRYNTVPTAINIAKYIVLPSLILWAFNHDEDWYKELDPNIKNTNWILPGGYRIPKPQDVGVIFGSGIEAMLDIASGKDKEAMNNWAETIKNNMAPNIIPTLFLPILEWQANYSYFRGGALVNRRLQQLPDELQYTNSTSELSKAIGNVTGLSPVKIDNTIRGYTGTMGMFLAQAPDMVIGDKRNLPEKRLSERVFLRDFNVTDMNLNRSVDEFYDMLADANKQHAGYGKKGKPSKVVKSIRNAGKMISDLNKDIQTITNSRLSPSVKRARIDKKRAEIKRIANIAVTKYGKYFD